MIESLLSVFFLIKGVWGLIYGGDYGVDLVLSALFSIAGQIAGLRDKEGK